MQILRNRNLIRLTDSYKLTHHEQDPPGTTRKHAYLSARAGARWDTTTWLGLQVQLKEFLVGTVVSPGDLVDAREFVKGHFGRDLFNDAGWSHIVGPLRGKLPLRVWALPEGTQVPVGKPMLAIENTDDRCHWLPNAVETLLTHVWYPSTTATLSREIKRKLLHFLQVTGCEDIPGVLRFMLHDFAGRGVTCMEAGGFGGIGHIANFQGTDTVRSIDFVQDYYSSLPYARRNELMPAFSVPATEHSTITSWTEAGELDAYANLLDKNPTGVIACVSDSWDLLNAIGEMWGRKLKDRVLSRDGRLVMRPDSGDPIETNIDAVRIAGARFGTTNTRTGHKLLHPKTRLLQGDGMGLESVGDLLQAAMDDGWAAENWSFGMGGGLLQKVDRDIQRITFKCSHAVVNGEPRDVFKRPKTDPLKNSLPGRQNEGMDLVYENGELLVDTPWADVVARAELDELKEVTL